MVKAQIPVSPGFVSVIVAAIGIHQLLSKQFPHGRPVDLAPSNRHSGPPMDPTNVSLRLSNGKLTKIYERVEEEGSPGLMVGPETLIFDNNGTMYTLTEQSKLVSITDFRQKRDDDDASIMTAKVTEVADLGIGRSIGGKFDSGSCLYFADILKGLCRICLDRTPKPVVELVASRFQLEDGSWSDVTYADDVDIGPRTGHVYFSDATDVKLDRDLKTGKWDIWYPSKLEGIRGLKSGRLLRYKPETGEVDLIASGAHFANGVAVDAQESFVVFTSTFEGKVMKYHLTGEKEGQLETILTDFPGFLDGIDCSFDSSLCFVAMPAPATPELKALFAIRPAILSRLIRTILMLLPRGLTPDAKPYGGVAIVHRGDEFSKPSVKQIYQDPTGIDISVITGVTEGPDGKLYLGSLHNDFIGVLDYQ